MFFDPKGKNAHLRMQKDEHGLLNFEKMVPEILTIEEPDRTLLMRQAIRGPLSIFIASVVCAIFGGLIYILFITWQDLWPEFFTSMNSVTTNSGRRSISAEWIAFFILLFAAIYPYLKIVQKLQTIILKRLIADYRKAPISP